MTLPLTRVTRRALGSLLLATLACSGSERTTLERGSVTLWPATSSSDTLRRRVIGEVSDTLFVIGGSPRDTTLLLPLRVVAAGDRVYVYDEEATKVIAFDHAGRQLWSYGRRGGGPGEFAEVRDMKLTPEGHLSILDMGNRRIERIDDRGQLVTRVPLGDVGHAEQHMPLAAGQNLLLTMASTGALALIDSAGRIIEQHDLPWPDYAQLQAIARQGLLARDGVTHRWMFGFSAGNGWFAFDSLRAASFVGRYVEHVEFPPVVVTQQTSGEKTTRSVRMPRRSLSARGIAVSDSVVYVLFEGRTDLAARVVDTYRWVDGQYLGSFKLPSRAVAIGVAGKVLYAIVHDPLPALLALRTRPAQPT